MVKKPINQLARDLEAEFQWFSQVLEARLHLFFQVETAVRSVYELTPPALKRSTSYFADLLRRYDLGFAERIALVLALSPHMRPELLDPFFTRNSSLNRHFVQFGGTASQSHEAFLATGDTLLFILAGDDLAARIDAMRLFRGETAFFQAKLLYLGSPLPDRPATSGVLQLSGELLSQLTVGKAFHPDFSSAFPATRLQTPQDWEDLILPAQTMEGVEEIFDWIQHQATLMEDWGLKRKLRPGMRALFYGPPGTGKTLTASLLGKRSGLEVYRIDLSMVVSKFIGETEKNLSRVFDMAQNQQWILFFDEADALFGKRTEVKDAHDRYANQEVSYLLQRIESFDGIVILASNLKGNVDEAFLRRFESVVYFPFPSVGERLAIWQKSLEKGRLDPDVDLQSIAQQYELSGGDIINVVRFAALRAIRHHRTIQTADLIHGIRKEYHKIGRSL